ncbi:MAG: ATP-grasp domain-containing protein, partial [Gemmatimonadetes bacterium]|nr:ATP-grasp domain-containing protein [Gemmatimonadota bacterium]
VLVRPSYVLGGRAMRIVYDEEELRGFFDEAARVAQMREHTRAFARALGVVGLINVQYAVKDGVVYVLEVNPRASRTIPFVSKTTGVPLAKLAAAVMAGTPLDALGLTDDPAQPYVAVKEAVFPFAKFAGVDVRLGPEMRSTGEVMGIADSFGMAFAKSQASAGGDLPLEGTVFVSV